MNNKLLENIAFQEFEDWKSDLSKILSDEPRWFTITDENLIAKLEAQDSGEVPFVPSVYRKDNGNWEVDVAHANFFQLPYGYKKDFLAFANRAIYIIQNFGKGLSKGNRINRCYKNALTMLSATEKQFEGDIEDFVKQFLSDKAKGDNIVYKIDDSYIFTKLDTLQAVYAKIYKMSQQDKKELEDYYAIDNYYQIKHFDSSKVSVEEIIARGEKVIPPILHEDWEKCVEKYADKYVKLHRTHGWNRNSSDEILKSEAKRSLFKVVQLIEDLSRRGSTKSVSSKIDNILELALVVKFGKNGNLIAENVGFVLDEKPKKAKADRKPQKDEADDAENE